MYFRPASLPEIPFFSTGTHWTLLCLFVRVWCTSIKLWSFTFFSLWLDYLCFYPRVPIKKEFHAILQKSMKVNMGDLSRTAPFLCHHAHRAWLLLLVESNWNRCCINIYKSSLKHYLICLWEMLHVEHFLWPDSQVASIPPCFLHTLCTLPVEFHIIHNLLFISQNVWKETSMSLFSPELAREHCSLKRSLCSKKLKNSNQTSRSTNAGRRLGGCPASTTGLLWCLWDSARPALPAPGGRKHHCPHIFLSFFGFSWVTSAGSISDRKRLGTKPSTGVSAFAWPAAPHSILIFCSCSSL